MTTEKFQVGDRVVHLTEMRGVVLDVGGECALVRFGRLGQMWVLTTRLRKSPKDNVVAFLPRLVERLKMKARNFG